MAAAQQAPISHLNRVAAAGLEASARHRLGELSQSLTDILAPVCRGAPPTVAGAQVEAKITAQDRDKKIIVFKFKRRKNYRRKNGHRQPFTEIQITGIEG